MYCKNCGSVMDPNASVCVTCGCAKGAGSAYCHNCGQSTLPGASVCTSCGCALTRAMGRKSKIAAGLLGIFLGGWGVHSFYLGNIKKGVLQIVEMQAPGSKRMNARDYLRGKPMQEGTVLGAAHAE